MLTYFPTPYPNEWWYSVLCRYHVRSGYSKFATTNKELYNGKPVVHGRLIPGSDCFAIVDRLPDNFLSLEHILQNHTLLPYYLRFYPLDKKKAILKLLKSGKSSGITNLETKMPDGCEGLKFCPQCYEDDKQQYGEAYWHREHQIPLMPICQKHKIPLVVVKMKFSRLSEIFVPLSSIRNHKQDLMIESWMCPLTDIIWKILTLPYEIGATVQYSNLYLALLGKNFYGNKITEQSALDSKKIKEAALKRFGENIYAQYISKLSPAIISRLIKWQLTSPERYALLCVIAGIDAEILFGTKLETQEPLLIKLKSLKKAGVIYQKNELAESLNVSPAQLDSMSRKYSIEPFWKQNGKERKKIIKLLLTESEYETIKKAAQSSGNGQLAVFARTAILKYIKEIMNYE